jgi:hypothetical protein
MWEPSGDGLNDEARTALMPAWGRCVSTRGPTCLRGQGASSAASNDHVSPYWYIRGVAPHRLIRRW